MEEASRKNDQFKFSTLERPGSPAEDSAFDADNLPSFNLSSPIASSTPRATSKFLAKEGKRVGEETIFTIDQYQDSDDTERNATILRSNSGFLSSKEAERPMSQNSIWSASEADITGDAMGFKEERDARQQKRAQRDLRRGGRWQVIHGDSSHPEARDQDEKPQSRLSIREILEEDSSGSLSLHDVDLITPRPRVPKPGTFTGRFRPQRGDKTGEDNSELRSGNRSSEPHHGIKPPFSTSMRDLPDPTNLQSVIEKSPPKPRAAIEPVAPKILPTEDESTADVTKEMEVAGAPVVVLRRSRRNREASKSPEEIAANESEVRDALRAFSRQASASPSNDQNLTEETREITNKGKGKQTVQIEDYEEDIRPLETDFWESRQRVADSLSTKQVKRSLHQLVRESGFGNPNQQTKERLEEQVEEKQAARTMTEQPVPNIRSVAEDEAPPAKYPNLKNLFLRKEGRRRVIGSSLEPQTTSIAPTISRGAAPLTSTESREAAAEAGLRRSKQTIANRPISPLLRPSTPESRKNKAHLYGKGQLQSPGSDYNFDEDSGIDRELVDLLSIRPGQQTQPVPPPQPPQRTEITQLSKRLQQAQSLPDSLRASENPSQDGQECKTAKQSLPVEPMHANLAEVEPAPLRKHFSRLKGMLFGYSRPTTQPRSADSDHATTQPVESTRTMHPPSSNPPQAPPPAQSTSGSQALPISTKGGAYFSSTLRKGNQGVTVDDPTAEGHASLHSLSSERDPEYQIPATDPSHQRVPRKTGDSDIEANPRFIILLKEAEMSLLRKMNNRLETLQLEIRSTKQGIETLEQRLMGSDSEISSNMGTEMDASAEQTAPECTDEEHTEVSMDEMLKTYIARQVTMEQAAADARAKQMRGANRWVVEQKWALVLGLGSIAFFTFLLLEILMLLVCVKVPCRLDTEFTNRLCRLCYLPTLKARIPVNEGDDLEYLPLGSPILGLLLRTVRVPGILLKNAGIGQVGGWIAGWFIWLSTVLRGSASTWAGVVWGMLKSWGEILVSVVVRIWRIFLTALSFIWAIVSWGNFTTTTSDQVNITTSFAIPTSACIVPTSIPGVLTGHTASGSMGDDDTVPTIIVDAGLETPTVVEEQEKWWIEYQEEKRKETAGGDM